MKILVVDDEALARERLLRLLATVVPDAEVFEASGGEQALELAAARQPDLPQLALELGYSSQSHFCGSFQREFGCTPSAARRGLPAAELGRMSKILQDVAVS